MYEGKHLNPCKCTCKCMEKTFNEDKCEFCRKYHNEGVNH